MIHLQDFQLKFANVKEQLENSLFHPYLKRKLPDPFIDEDKLLLLVAFLNQAGLSDKDIAHYSVTTMLLQVALDTHEIVQNSSPEEEPLSARKRQLTVLAGTYYSGLFYKQLAEAGHIELIMSLADGVKEMNEYKITVYHRDCEAIEGLMESIKKIESCLLDKVCDSFEAEDWKELISSFLFAKRLVKEREEFLQTGTSIIFDALKPLAFPKSCRQNGISAEQKQYLLSIVDRYFDHSAGIIEEKAKKLPPVTGQLHARMNELLAPSRLVTKITLEEG